MYRLLKSVLVLGILGTLVLQPFSGQVTDSEPIDPLALLASDLPAVIGVRDSLYGEIVSGIGDYNDDGYGDMIVGGRGWNGWQGKTWIYYGSPDGPGKNADFTIRGEPNIDNSGICLGHTVVNLGDVNGDGISDFAAGGPGSWGGWEVGKLYIFYGDSDKEPEIASEADQILISPIKFDWFAESFTLAGDYNGDGLSDLLVGAPGTSYPADGTAPFETGYAYIFLGSTSGYSSSPDITLRDNLNYTAYGLMVGGEGDVNNDGFDDIVVGASWSNNFTGRAHVYLGSSNPDTEPEADLILTGKGQNDYFGAFVRIIKDINNDGYDEIAIRTTNTSHTPFQETLQIYYGQDDISGITKPNITLFGNDPQDDFAYTFNEVGDLNQDGHVDLAVGAPGTVSGQPGKVYIYHGGLAFDDEPDRIYTGEDSGDRFGYWVAGSDLDGDHISDLMMTSLYHGSVGKVYISLSGNGTLRDNADPGSDNTILLVVAGSAIVVIALVLVIAKKRNLF